MTLMDGNGGTLPFNPLCREYAQDVDWLMHEAFCTYADRERFQPYEKNHATKDTLIQIFYKCE